MEPMLQPHEILAIKTYFTATYTLLVYDYFLTLPKEIEFAWKDKRTFVTVLFFMNRYISLVFSTVVMMSYFLAPWTSKICNHFVIWEFIYIVLIFTIAETFLALRVYILSQKNIYLASGFIFHLLAQLGLAFYVISLGGGSIQGLPLSSGYINLLQICVMIPRPETTKYYTAYLSLALSFDAIVFVATLIITLVATRQFHAKPWLRVIQRDGIIYFMAIFSSTLVWLLFNQIGGLGLKFMNNLPDLIFTSVMINRLYLSLKKAGRIKDASPQLYLRRKQSCGGMELQVRISREVTSVVQ